MYKGKTFHMRVNRSRINVFCYLTLIFNNKYIHDMTARQYEREEISTLGKLYESLLPGMMATIFNVLYFCISIKENHLCT